MRERTAPALGLAFISLLAAALPTLTGQQASKSGEAVHLPKPQRDALIETFDVVIEKAKTESAKDGTVRTIPEYHVWLWTTADAVEKAAGSAGCKFSGGSRLIEKATPATSKVVGRTNRSHKDELRCARGTFDYPDSYWSVSSASVDGKAFLVSMELCPDRELRTVLSSAKDRPDPFLRYCRSVVQLHDASIRKVFNALVSGRSAQDRIARLLDELARGETMENWFWTCESSVGPVADAPLCGPPMLYAQVDLHMWLDVICCGDGPVVLELSGWPEKTYRDMCTAATEQSKK